MWLSDGWRRLLRFWVWVVALFGISAGTLQIFGPSGPNEGSARERHPDALSVPTGSLVAVAFPAVEQVEQAEDLVTEPPGEAVETSPPRAHDPPPRPVMMAALEFTGVMDHDRFTMDPQPAASDQAMVVAKEVARDTNEDLRSKTRPPLRQLHLRIVGDSNLCSKPACSTWHLVRAEQPHVAAIDLAQLRLAPRLREAVANGEVEVIIDAVERHKTIKGRDVVTIVPMNLAGATPHKGAASVRPGGPLPPNSSE